MLLDIIAGLAVVYGFYQGFTKGLIKTVFATVSLLIGIVAALKLSGFTENLLESALNLHPSLNFAISFVLTFVVVMALIRFIGGRIDKLMQTIHIGGVNKLLGGALLGMFYAVLISFGVFFLDKIELISDDLKSSSFAYPVLQPLPEASRGIGEALKPMFSDFWDRMLETMDAIKDKGEELELKEVND